MSRTRLDPATRVELLKWLIHRNSDGTLSTMRFREVHAAVVKAGFKNRTGDPVTSSCLKAILVGGKFDYKKNTPFDEQTPEQLAYNKNNSMYRHRAKTNSAKIDKLEADFVALATRVMEVDKSLASISAAIQLLADSTGDKFSELASVTDKLTNQLIAMKMDLEAVTELMDKPPVPLTPAPPVVSVSGNGKEGADPTELRAWLQKSAS